MTATSSTGRGCSLAAELARRGYATVEEPGRRIVKEELETGGSALSWIDPVAFARRAIAVAIADREAAAAHPGWVFFDRGLVDAAVALEHLTGEPAAPLVQTHPYHPTVFLTPPWPEIYGTDPERRHGFEAAEAEYARLAEAYPALAYRVVVLPKEGVGERADFALRCLFQYSAKYNGVPER